MENPAPSDPMWATFRERHPDVNLVLLPGDGGIEEPAMATAVSVAEARDVAFSLERRVRLIGDILAVPHDPVLGWERVPGYAYQPTVRLNGSVSPDTPDDAEVIQHRLSQLGWDANVRPESELVWVDGKAGDDFVRVTVVNGIVAVRATGAPVGLDQAAVAELIGGTDARH